LAPTAKKNFAHKGDGMLVNLKTALAVRCVKQVELASEVDITPSVLSEIIHERRKANAALRARIARELHADEAWLFAQRTSVPAPRNLETQPAPVMA